jgi:hypothetical protein
VDLWGTDGSEVAPNRDCSASRASRPSRRESSDRDMWPSWELGSRFKEMARWRSRRESLIWSARRKSCDGFDMVEFVEDDGWTVLRGEFGWGQGDRRIQTDIANLKRKCLSTNKDGSRFRLM